MNEAVSPYAPPKSNLEGPIEERELVEVAGKGLRFANYIIDGILATLLSTGIFIGLFNIFSDRLLFLAEGLTGIAYDWGFYVGFYLLFEGATGRSPGKFITGTLVIDENGDKPTISQILGRSFSRIVPFEPFTFLGSKGRGWHDTWSKTYVVKARGNRYGQIKLSDDLFSELTQPIPDLNELPETEKFIIKPGMKHATIITDKAVGTVKYRAFLEEDDGVHHIQVTAEYDDKVKEVLNRSFVDRNQASGYLAENTLFRFSDFKA